MQSSARLPNVTLLISAVLLPFSAIAGDGDTAMLPAWLAGDWCNASPDHRSEERWVSPAGGLMLGVSRTVAKGRKTQFEFLRIELVDDVPTYVAQPQGRAGTAFKRSASGEDWIRFENLTHDFPQRIEYRRSGDTLQAEIAGPGDDGKTMTIPFEFSPCTL